MAYEIEFSRESVNQIRENINYLVENWSVRIADEFINKLNFKIEVISLFPYSYPKSTSTKTIRKCVVTKQMSLLYKIKNKKIIILALLDTRQSPDNVKS